jgi:hypothetical protein
VKENSVFVRIACVQPPNFVHSLHLTATQNIVAKVISIIEKYDKYCFNTKQNNVSKIIF